MKTYDQAPAEVHDRVKALIKRFHPDLEKVGLRVDLLMAATDAEDGNAVTLHGYPCQAVVKILGPKERAMERGDAEIVIDLDNYESLTPKERDALLDHELYHLEVKRDKNGKPKKDAYQRPVLKMKLHDREFGWFDEVARRHGANSLEVQQAQAFADEAGQLYLNIGDVPFKNLTKDGATVTIKSGGKGVIIDKGGIRPIAA